MFVVTGGAGFIGSNLVKQLNEKGENKILVVDDLTEGIKFSNIVDCKIHDYIDKDDFLNRLPDFGKIKAIFHQGACSSTTEWNGQYMMKNNYEYSKVLLHFCVENNIPFIYASSAAVYGRETIFKEDPSYENPLNVYGYSKLLLDRYVRANFSKCHSQIVGLRYFNVYGPREQHKQSMASVMWHFRNQLAADGTVKLFDAYEQYAAGEQKRDFVYVEDIVDVNTWFYENPDKNGIFNVGTGKSRTFNDVANSVISCTGLGSIKYIPFPDHLKGFYQSFTEADITNLRTIGYKKEFTPIEVGVRKYFSEQNDG